MTATASVFDLPHATALAAAKAEVLRELLPVLRAQAVLTTALDVGCGVGHFSELLRSGGFDVVAVDAREDNIAEARRRHPGIQFAVRDVEAAALADLGMFDFVLCFGLLYHLENPFRAIRNLRAVTRKICVVESMVAPFASAVAAFVEEGAGEDQGQTYLAQIPSEAWLLKALAGAGFRCLYRYARQPRHPDFRRRLYRKRRRVMFVASTCRLAGAGLRPARVPEATGRFMWYTFGIGKLLDRPRVRRALKSAARAWRAGRPRR